MTAEQLEELLSALEGLNSDDDEVCVQAEIAEEDLASLAPSLARRVVMADRVIDLLDATAMAHPDMQAAVTAYREASK